MLGTELFKGLCNQMMALIHQKIEAGRDHVGVCRDVAEECDLWDDKDCFPIWLSRIVAGEMNDMGYDTDNGGKLVG